MEPIAYYNAAEELLDPDALARLQRQKLAAMLREIQGHNAFYKRKFAGIAFDPIHNPLENLPFTTRAELEADQLERPPYGSNLTYPLAQYCRLHQTSGSGGRAVSRRPTRARGGWFQHPSVNPYSPPRGADRDSGAV